MKNTSPEHVLKTTDNSTQTLKRPQLFKTGAAANKEKSRFFKKHAVNVTKPEIFKLPELQARIFPISGLFMIAVLLACFYRLSTQHDDVKSPLVQVSKTDSSISSPVTHPEKPATILDIDPVPEMFKTNTTAPAGHPISSETLTDSKNQHRSHNRHNSAAMVSIHKLAVKDSVKSRLPMPPAAFQQQTAAAVSTQPVSGLGVPTVNETPETALDADEEVLKAIIAHAEKSTSK